MMNHIDNLKNFIETQLELWSLAKENYKDLDFVKTTRLRGLPYPIIIQNNPKRIVSTGADISYPAIEKRPCFLCCKNRPEVQIIYKEIENFEILINPYPIFKNHLTIVYKSHVPQDRAPESILNISKSLSGMAIFFNGALAGASAPDHLHLQAVEYSELPLLKYIEKKISPKEISMIPSFEINKELPFFFFTGVVSDNKNNIKELLRVGGGEDFKNKNLVNIFFWTDKDTDVTRYLIIPRRKHRPSCYFKEKEEKLLVSPGSIDMGGVIITPRLEDFNSINIHQVKHIYQEIAFRSDERN